MHHITFPTPPAPAPAVPWQVAEDDIRAGLREQTWYAEAGAGLLIRSLSVYNGIQVLEVFYQDLVPTRTLPVFSRTIAPRPDDEPDLAELAFWTAVADLAAAARVSACLDRLFPSPP